MRLYSDLPRARALQIAGDAVALVVLVGGIVLAVALHGAIAALEDVGNRVAASGTGFSTTLGDIGRQLGGVPLIGSGIRAPFDGAAGAGSALATAGAGWSDGVERIAAIAGWTVALLVVLVVLAGWVRPRLAGALRRGTVARLSGDVDLLALRALAGRPTRALAAIGPDAAAAWRRGDPDIVKRLAGIALADAGLRPLAG
ncbi:MAG TPA: hypothetical protein VIG76_00985 [Amnibacterium sp.]|jgi:hypothetical protein|uniref:hypothetical protein n=1 Tax=Amnibacterium sp. TaxID=1872496 RepID=UPI002F94E4A0